MERIFAMMIAVLLMLPLPAAADVNCDRDEKDGCLSIQGLTVVYDDRISEMDFVEDRPRPGTRAYAEAMADATLKLYKLAKRDRVEPAGRRKFSVYMWNVDDTSTDRMSEHRLGTNISRGTTPHKVTEVDVNWIGRFDPAFARANGLDSNPDRQFEVTSGGYAFSLVVPWDMIGDNTWIAICPWKGDAMYPDQRGDKNEVIWLSPKKLKQLRDGGKEWVFRPFIYPSKDFIFELLG